MSPDALPEPHIPDHSTATSSPSPLLDPVHIHTHTPSLLQLKLDSHAYTTSPLPSYSPSPTESEFLTHDLYMPSPLDSHFQTSSAFLVPFHSSSSQSLESDASSVQDDHLEATPEADYRFPPPSYQAGPSSARPRVRSSAAPPDSPGGSPSIGRSHADIAHPYARLYTRREGTKRRKMWNHALEKAIFTPQEISTMGAPHRRKIYTASLEAHVDRLHAQLLSYALFPVPFEKLERFRGLNSRTAKSMVAGLHRDMCDLKMKRLELDRASHALRNLLLSPPSAQPPHPHASSSAIGLRRHSLDS